MQVNIPYGKTFLKLEGDYPGAEVLRSGGITENGKNEDEIVLDAMRHPIGSPPLRDLAAGKRSAVLLISDHTRPVPSRHILPFMLRELREGSPEIDVTLLVATGFHRGTTKEELIGKVGPEIYEREKVIVHDCWDDCVDIGALPSGARLSINRLAAETELLVAEGFVEPHFFAGFSGGRKSVLPGICSHVTVMGNHCSAFIDSPYSRTGVLENNPIHRDTVEAARLAKLAYIVNVILDADKKVAAAFAGDAIAAHAEGCRVLASHCVVRPKRAGDIVVSSNGGAPLDQNVYQAVKGLTAAEAAAAPGAILILCASCSDGIGGEGFYNTLRTCESPQALMEQILKVPMEETKPDQWQYQIIARVLMKHDVIFVAEPKVKSALADMKLNYAPTLEEALQTAYARKGKDAHLVVIPDGISVIVQPAEG